MADQGKNLITMTVPSAAARGLLVSGAGTYSATLKPVGVVYDSTLTTGQVQISGTCLVTTVGVIAVGTLCRSDANGKAIACVTGTDGELGSVVLLEAGAADQQTEAKIV